MRRKQQQKASACEACTESLASQILQDSLPWRRGLFLSANFACRAALHFGQTPETFKDFHDSLCYTLPDGSEVAAPTMRLQPVISVGSTQTMGTLNCAFLSTMQLDIKMCNHCAKVSRTMNACARCTQVFYCDVSCQRAAWKAHKVECGKYMSVLASPEGQVNVGTKRRLAGRSLREVLQPGRPQLCRFWLAALVSALEGAVLYDASSALEPLIAYLWKYTFAAVPESLRARFISACASLTEKLAADMQEGVDGLPRGVVGKTTVRQGPSSSRQMRAHVTMIQLTAIVWLLATDEDFKVWKAAQPAGEIGLPLVPVRLDPDTNKPVDASKTAREAIAKSILNQDGYAWQGAKYDDSRLHSGTALLRGCAYPRGHSLLASSFGVLHARATAERIMKDWARYALGEAPLSEIERHAVPFWAVTARHPVMFDARPLPARQAELGHVLIRPDSVLHRYAAQSVTMTEMAELLCYMRGQGCKAVPVEICAWVLPRELFALEDEHQQCFEGVLSPQALLDDARKLKLDAVWMSGLSTAITQDCMGPNNMMWSKRPTDLLLP